MDNIYIYCTDLPNGLHEMVTPCADGYTVYLSNKLDKRGKLRAFHHAIDHIAQNDFDGGYVQTIEYVRHQKTANE